MMITGYRFGRITIDGKEFTGDIKVIKGKIVPNWWRSQGHLLQLDDIRDIIDAKPEVLVVGTGAAGVMRIHPEVEEYLQKKGISLRAVKSSEAVKIFNNLLQELGPDKVSLAIHLTC